MNDMLRVENVNSGYGQIPILHEVSLAIGTNESVAIIGANGAGKSTLVRTVAGLLPLAAGSIFKNGRSIGKMTPHSRVQEGLGVVLENRHLFGEMSVHNNLDLARVEGARRQVAHRFTLEDVISLFPFIGQRLQSQVAVLSGGEQQMVAIARALLLQPNVLILDEPSTGLAPKVLSHIAEVVVGLRNYGISILLIEQNVAFAAKIADRAYVMSLGRVVREIPAGQWDHVVRDQTLLRAYLGGDPRMPQTTH